MINKKLIIYLLSGLFVLSSFFLLFSLGYSSVDEIALNNLKAKFKQIKVAEQKFDLLKQSYQEWKNISETYLRFKKAHLLDYNEFSTFRSKLKKMIAGNNLESLKLRYITRGVFRDITGINLNLTLAGNYKNIKKFICDMENEPKILYFKSINLSRMKNDILIGNFSLEVYFAR